MGWRSLYFNALASSQQGAFPFSKGTFLFSEGTLSFATPAWQTCRAGVANHQVPCTNGKISRKNGCAPCRNGGWASRSVRTLPGGRRTAGGDGDHAGHRGCYGRGAPFARQRAAAHLAKIYQQGCKGAFEAAKMKFKACKCKSSIWGDACKAVFCIFAAKSVFLPD